MNLNLASSLFIMNRFSKDIDIIDVNLPSFSQKFLLSLAPVFSIIIVILYSLPVFIAFFIPVAVIFCLLQVIMFYYYYYYYIIVILTINSLLSINMMS